MRTSRLTFDLGVNAFLAILLICLFTSSAHAQIGLDSSWINYYGRNWRAVEVKYGLHVLSNEQIREASITQIPKKYLPALWNYDVIELAGIIDPTRESFRPERWPSPLILDPLTSPPKLRHMAANDFGIGYKVLHR